MKTVVENIVDLSDDPIECATYLQKYLNKLPRDEQYLESFLGLKGLGYKFYGPYKETRPLTIAANGGFGLYDNDCREKPIDEQRFEGRMRVMGRMATFGYRNIDGNNSIVLRVSQPRLVDTHLINNDGVPVTNFVEQFPVPEFTIVGHYTVPVLDVIQYKFATDES